MPSTFMTLNTGVSALQAMQQAENVVGNNIANANTTGYSEETVNLADQGSYPYVPGPGGGIAGQVGEGVQVSSVTRQDNAFYDAQDRANQGTLQMYTSQSAVLTQVESILNEPSDNGLQNALDQFFQSWQTLSTDPTNTAARQAILTQTQTMGQTFQTVTNQLEQLQSNLQGVVQGQISELNQDAQQVASLNQQIAAITAYGENPNQLLDQRGVLLDQMSQLANITYSNDPSGNGAVDVSITSASGTPIQLVQGSQASSYPTGNAALANITSGEIAGNVQGIDDISGILSNLNAFLTQLSTQVNNQQSAGYGLDGTTGNNLIQTTTDASGNVILGLDPNMTTDKIAAAQSSGQPGDNSNAIAIANIQQATQSISFSYNSLATNQTVSGSGSGTFDQLIAQVVTGVGTQAAAVNSSEQTANALAQQSSQLRQSVSGVSLDEQAALMIQYQSSYNAAAKFISVFDDMLQTLMDEIN